MRVKPSSKDTRADYEGFAVVVSRELFIYLYFHAGSWDINNGI